MACSIQATRVSSKNEYRIPSSVVLCEQALREQRQYDTRYGDSSADKHQRLRLIPEWLEKNQDFTTKSKPPNSVNDPDACEELMKNVLEGSSIAVKLLAEAGVNLNMKDSEGRTPLHHAVINGHDDIIEILMDKGADGKIKNNQGLTPFEEIKKPKITRDRSRPVSRQKTTFRSSLLNTRSTLYTSFEVQRESKS